LEEAANDDAQSKQYRRKRRRRVIAIFIYHGESKEQLLETATRLLPCLTEGQLAYIIGMEQAEEYKEKEGAKEDDKSVL